MFSPKTFLLIIVIFGAFLIVSIVQQSRDRSSVVSSLPTLDNGEGQTTGSAGEEESKLQLQDFHRVEMKDGKIAWEIRAKEAKYFSDAKLTHINDAVLVVYDENNLPVHIDATVAKLFINGTQLGKAELEGAIVVRREDGTTLETTAALYEGEEQVITSQAPVQIRGLRYKIEAVGFRYSLSKNELILHKQVQSVFELG